ncbi:MAG TPA: hypothetical protein VEX18_09940, partial [Polyangiaceae bacterium]|nr:hypothetical protein [Polyangiaceae bacterium]
MTGRSAFFVGTCLALCGACGAASEGTPQANLPRASRPTKARTPLRSALPLAAHRFAEVSDVIGPYVGRDGDAALAAWAEPSARGRNLLAASIDAKGVPGPSNRIGQLPAELDLVLVRGFGAASGSTTGRPRFAVISTRRSEQLTQLHVTAVAANGSAVWGPTALAERNARVLWIGFIVAGSQPLLLWAEQPPAATGGEPAALYALPISADGKPATPQPLAAKACAWQVASVGERAALATVRSAGNTCTTGPVTLELLDAAGKPEKVVDLGGRAALDLDLVGGPDVFVLAWSDQQQLEPRVHTALVDARGVVRAAAAPAIASVGEQAVVALVPGATATSP